MNKKPKVIKKPKPKKCQNKDCGNLFTPARLGQIACCPKCAFIIINSPDNKIKERVSRELAKVARAEHKEMKDRVKPIRKWESEAQSAINKYVKLRDFGKPCISCGQYMNGSSYYGRGTDIDCGHFRTRAAASHLRFNLHNMAAQCVSCNQHRGGNQLAYRAGLIERIGLEKVEEIENNNKVRKFDVDYLKRIKTIFTKKSKKLEKRIKARGDQC